MALYVYNLVVSAKGEKRRQLALGMGITVDWRVRRAEIQDWVERPPVSCRSTPKPSISDAVVSELELAFRARAVQHALVSSLRTELDDRQHPWDQFRRHGWPNSG